MLMAVQHGLCARRAACCDLAQVLAVCLNPIDRQMQQHVTSSVFSCGMQCRLQCSRACVYAVLHAVV